MSMQSKLLDSGKLVRFAAVGLVNTAVGYLVIVLALSLGAGDLPSNALGYGVGLSVSYLLNSKWTFRQARLGFGTTVRYAALFATAYGTNLVIVLMAARLGFVENPLVHLVGLGAYTALFFVGAQTFVFGDHAAAKPQLFIKAFWPEVLTACALVTAWLLMRHNATSHDVVWQMWIARQLLGGAQLYVDILELNPPLWFWLAMPVQKAAQLLDVAPKQAIITAVFIYALLAALAVALLVAHLDPWRRAVMLAATTTATIFLPIFDFAQREHLALIAALPYAIIAARRADGQNVHWSLALFIGVLAAFGFALKHYFIAVPLLLEVWLVLRLRRSWRPIRPETAVLAVGALLYAVAIYIVTPEYATTIVPMVNRAYFGYEVNIVTQLFRPFVIFWVFAALVLIKLRTFSDSMTLATAIAGGGFVLSYFLQQKGFNYHATSATGMLFVSLGSLLRCRSLAGSSLRIVAGSMLMPLLVSVLLGPYKNPNEEKILHLLEGTDRGKPVMMLNANPSKIWPMNEDRGYVWPSRHFALWMFTAFGKELRKEGQLSPALQDLAREMRAQTAADLACNPPDLIIVQDLYMTHARGLDAVAFLSVDPEFRSFFSHYKKRQIWGEFTSYVKRNADWNPVRPSACRVVH